MEAQCSKAPTRGEEQAPGLCLLFFNGCPKLMIWDIPTSSIWYKLQIPVRPDWTDDKTAWPKNCLALMEQSELLLVAEKDSVFV